MRRRPRPEPGSRPAAARGCSSETVLIEKTKIKNRNSSTVGNKVFNFRLAFSTAMEDYMAFFNEEQYNKENSLPFGVKNDEFPQKQANPMQGSVRYCGGRDLETTGHREPDQKFEHSRLSMRPTVQPGLIPFRTVTLSVRREKLWNSSSPKELAKLNQFDPSPDFLLTAKQACTQNSKLSTVRRLPKNLNNLFEKCSPASPAIEANSTLTSSVTMLTSQKRDLFVEEMNGQVCSKLSERSEYHSKTFEKRKLTEKDLLGIMRDKKRWKRDVNDCSSMDVYQNQVFS